MTKLFETEGMVFDGYFKQFGGIPPEEENFLIDLQFRLATNGVIVNTLVDYEPLITTSAGSFN